MTRKSSSWLKLAAGFVVPMGISVGGCTPSAGPAGEVSLSAGSGSAEEAITYFGDWGNSDLRRIRITADRASFRRGSLTNVPRSASTCSGAQLSPNHVVTAQHCIPADLFSGTANPDPWALTTPALSSRWFSLPSRPATLPSGAAFPSYYSAAVVECGGALQSPYKLGFRETGNDHPNTGLSAVSMLGYVEGRDFVVAQYVGTTTRDVALLYVPESPSACGFTYSGYWYPGVGGDVDRPLERNYRFCSPLGTNNWMSASEWEVRCDDAAFWDSAYTSNVCVTGSPNSGKVCASSADCGGYSCVAPNTYLLKSYWVGSWQEQGSAAGLPLNGWMSTGENYHVTGGFDTRGRMSMTMGNRALAFTHASWLWEMAAQGSWRRLCGVEVGDAGSCTGGGAAPGASGGPFYTKQDSPDQSVAAVYSIAVACEGLVEKTHCEATPSCTWTPLRNGSLGSCESAKKGTGTSTEVMEVNGLTRLLAVQTDLRNLMNANPAATAWSPGYLVPWTDSGYDSRKGLGTIAYACTAQTSTYLADGSGATVPVVSDAAEGGLQQYELTCSTATNAIGSLPAASVVNTLQQDHNCQWWLDILLSHGYYPDFPREAYADDVLHLEFLDQADLATRISVTGFPGIRSASVGWGSYGEGYCQYEVGYMAYNSSTASYSLTWLPLVDYVLGLAVNHRVGGFPIGGVSPINVGPGKRLKITRSGTVAKHCDFAACEPGCQAGCEVLFPLEKRADKFQIANLQTCETPADSGLTGEFYPGSWICKFAAPLTVSPSAVLLTQLATQAYFAHSRYWEGDTTMPARGFVSSAASGLNCSDPTNDPVSYDICQKKNVYGAGDVLVRDLDALVQRADTMDGLARDPADWPVADYLSYLKYSVEEARDYISVRSEVNAKYGNWENFMGQVMAGYLLHAAVVKADANLWHKIVTAAMSPMTKQDLDIISLAAFGEMLQQLDYGGESPLITAAAVNRITGAGFQRINETYLRGSGARISLDGIGRLISGTAFNRISAGAWGARISGGSWQRVTSGTWSRITSASLSRISDVALQSQFEVGSGAYVSSSTFGRITNTALARVTGATLARVSGSAWDRITMATNGRISSPSWSISGGTWGRITSAGLGRITGSGWNRVSSGSYGRITAAGFSRVTSGGWGRINGGQTRF